MPTRRLNEQVKRNRGRFPDDFMFVLSADEKAEVIANCDHLSQLKFSGSSDFCVSANPTTPSHHPFRYAPSPP